MMMRVAVCSRNCVIIEQVQEAVGRILGCAGCDGYKELTALLLAIDGGEGYRAVFLDIQWDQAAEGMDAAEKLFLTKPEMKVIYMTAYPEQYIQQIFLRPANISGFLIKPIDSGLLEEHLRKIAREEQKKELASLVVKNKGTVHSIRFEQILYLESVGHVVTIYTKTEAHNCYNRLEKLYERLPAYFVQCHKSYVVNMNEIRWMDKSQMVMENEIKIPISKARYRATKKCYNHYVEESISSKPSS